MSKKQSGRRRVQPISTPAVNYEDLPRYLEGVDWGARFVINSCLSGNISPEEAAQALAADAVLTALISPRLDEPTTRV